MYDPELYHSKGNSWLCMEEYTEEEKTFFFFEVGTKLLDVRFASSAVPLPHTFDYTLPLHLGENQRIPEPVISENLENSDLESNPQTSEEEKLKEREFKITILKKFVSFSSPYLISIQHVASKAEKLYIFKIDDDCQVRIVSFLQFHVFQSINQHNKHRETENVLMFSAF